MNLSKKTHNLPGIEIVGVKSILLLFLFSVLFILSINARSTENTAQSSVVSDLYNALTLQGINCDGITQYNKVDENSYDVACESGKKFSIVGTAGGILNVFDKLTGNIRKGVSSLLGTIPLTGTIFQQKDKMTEHEAEIARSLFSIVELSGNECDAIELVETIEMDEHIVTCINQQTYRVYNKKNGIVRVESIATNKMH